MEAGRGFTVLVTCAGHRRLLSWPLAINIGYVFDVALQLRPGSNDEREHTALRGETKDGRSSSALVHAGFSRPDELTARGQEEDD